MSTIIRPDGDVDDPSIVSDPDILGGRWVFAGTRIPVAIARYATTEGREWVLANYPRMTDAMIDAGLAWQFPPVQEARPVVEDLAVVCACGEATWCEEGSPAVRELSTGDHHYRCNVCGRRWSVTIGILDIELTEDDFGCEDDTQDADRQTEAMMQEAESSQLQ